MRAVRGGGQTVRMSDQRSWTVEHFSQANPVSEGHIEVAESGGWPSLTVYFHRSTALRLVP
jgi:hypothetical protein